MKKYNRMLCRACPNAHAGSTMAAPAEGGSGSPLQVLGPGAVPPALWALRYDPCRAVALGVTEDGGAAYLSTMVSRVK
jgi:hypothetical protein